MKSLHIGTALLLLSLSVVTVADAQAKAGRKAKDPAASGELDPARIGQELAEQRQLLIRTIQLQQQYLDLVMRLISSNKLDTKGVPVPRPTPAAPPAIAATPTPVEPDEEPAPVTPREPERVERTEPRPRPATPSTSGGSSGKGGAIIGSVKVSSGSPEGAVVFVDNVKAPSARDSTFVIKQANKQFIPTVAVVPRGTRVDFPNLDTVFHNTFSLSPGNKFDLGTYRAGDPAKSVVLLNSGVVQVFCNLHPQMAATILVVPNSLFAKVQADGSFRIEGVPAGKRRLVAWLPNSDAATQELEVVAGYNSEATFALTPGKKSGTHTNKFGQAYGSYKE